MNIRKNKKGMASLETLAVLTVWIFTIFLFINFTVVIASLMFQQSTVNRGAQQVAALGCLPTLLKNNLQQPSGVGATNIKVRAIAPIPKSSVIQEENGTPKTVWNRDKYLDSSGRIKGAANVDSPGKFTDLNSGDSQARCLKKRGRIPSGNFIFLQMSYQQSVPVLTLLGLGHSGVIEVNRNALVVSQTLQGEK